MKRTSTLASAALLIILGLVWTGCNNSPIEPLVNTPPNTRLSAGPPEATDTGFQVNLFWFGWDEDGFVDHYEIAWENTDEWITPIFTNDSLFVLAASESCCVEPLDFWDPDLRDSVYEQYHTFYVRAVDDNGNPDETPAVRSFNSKTIAPYTTVNFGPGANGLWGTDVKFKWQGEDDDGTVVGYLTTLLTREEFSFVFGRLPVTEIEFFAWMDTLTYRPRPDGSFDTSRPAWTYTEQDSIVYPNVPETATNVDNSYIFGVRAIDNAGAIEKVLNPNDNARKFNVTEQLDGPNITLSSNTAGVWVSGNPRDTAEIFEGEGVIFRWLARPGPSRVPVAGYSYAVDDSVGNDAWKPFSLNRTSFPEPIPGEEQTFWRPGPGLHQFFLRAVDEGGFTRLLVADLEVFTGPTLCSNNDRFILIVQDTNASQMQQNLIWPNNYEIVERGLIDYWFDGYSYVVHETRGGARDLKVSLLNCATSTFYFHGASVGDSDASELLQIHEDDPNPLSSYLASGGNLFLCGLQVAEAIRYFEVREDGERELQNFPVIFQNTETDTTFVPHWFATELGVGRINGSVGNTISANLEGLRLAFARANGSLPSNYPDLVFDPLTWPEGPAQGGFGFYDRDIFPHTNPDRACEIMYYANESSSAIGVRNLTSPGVNGNAFYLGFHPYFVDRPAFRSLIQTVMAEFGEVPSAP